MTGKLIRLAVLGAGVMTLLSSLVLVAIASGQEPSPSPTSSPSPCPCPAPAKVQKKKAKKKPVVVSAEDKSALRMMSTDPVPQCVWTPDFPDPCNCYYPRPNLDGGPAWAWKDCRVLEHVEPVISESPEPIPTPVPTPLPTPLPEEPGLRIGLQAWSLAAFTGDADRFTYGGRILADGPIANTWGKPLRMFARLDLSALPGQEFSITNVETFSRSAELRGGGYLRLAEHRSTGQLITTSIAVWGGFATIRNEQVLDRYLRSGGIALRLAEENSGAEITVGYCRDEAAGYIGSGQICVGGSVPIAKDTVVVGGNAVLNLSRASVTPQRDIFRFYVGVSIGDLIDAVRTR